MSKHGPFLGNSFICWVDLLATSVELIDQLYHLDDSTSCDIKCITKIIIRIKFVLWFSCTFQLLYSAKNNLYCDLHSLLYQFAKSKTCVTEHQISKIDTEG